MDAKNKYLFKLLIIGDSGVGKTCLLDRFTNNNFHVSAMNTIGIDFSLKTVEAENEFFQLQIWDTAGQERFRSITYSYYREVNGIIIVYDVTNEESFESVHNWIKDIDRYANLEVNKLIVANKIDLTDKRVIDFETGKKLADFLGIKYLETSAKDADNIETIFTEIMSDIKSRVNDVKNDKTASIKLRKSKNKSKTCCLII